MAKSKKPAQSFKTVAPNCKVCGLAVRHDIDVMLVTGWRPSYIREMFNAFAGEDYFTPNNISRHERHVNIDDPPIRFHIQSCLAHLRSLGWFESAEDGTPLPSVERALETIVRAGLMAAHTRMTIVEPTDMIAAIKLLDQIERHENDDGALLRELNVFTSAVKNVVPPEQWKDVLDEFNRLSEEAGQKPRHQFIRRWMSDAPAQH